jgi:hypothetical protein
MPRPNAPARLGSRNNSAQKVLLKPHNHRVKSNLSAHEDRTTTPNIQQPRGHKSSTSTAKRSPPAKLHQLPRVKQKAGFSFASSAGDEDDEDDEWVSSESGAATPVGQEGGSDQEDENEVGNSDDDDGETQASTPVDRHLEINFSRNRPHSAGEDDATSELAQDVVSPLRPHPRSPSRRHSRPSSMISNKSTKSDVSVRPHPLLRGQSNIRSATIPKITPLPPLTITEDDQSQQTLISRNNESPAPGQSFADSPSSMFSLRLTRRPSVSSAHSIATLPVHHAPREKDRTRTLSTISTSSSSAALSSLTHLPAISRPPSPRTVCFFPATNPHIHLETIHPLLPAPFLKVHLNTLATRQPLAESFHRVALARQRR